MRKKRVVILDFDGVIGDTEGLHFKKWNILLKPFKINISEEEYKKEYCGKSSSTEIPRLLKKKYPQITLSEKEIADKASEILKKLFKKEAKLMPGAFEALNWFRTHGFKMAVCSGRDPEELEVKLSAVGLSAWFPPQNRATEIEANGLGKPHPAMYKLILERLNLDAKDCVAIEDTESGVKSAKNAGLYIIALPNEFTKEHDFSLANRIIYGGWYEFLEKVNKIF